MEKNLTVFERTLHKIHITFAQDASVSNFTWSGAAKSMYGCECFHFDTDINGNEVIMTTPSLSMGLYKYQIFCKSRDNVEYLVLSGDINVKDKLCDCDQQPAIDGNESTAEVAVSPEVINVTVSLPGAEISGNYLAFEFLEDGFYNVTGDLSEMTNGTAMFAGWDNLTSFSVDLPALTDGYSMFANCSNLTSFSGDLPALTNGKTMFVNCSNLTTFSGDLPALTIGRSTFENCSNLASFSGDLPALTDGYSMFKGCVNLASFSGDLSALTNGGYMFRGCTNLTSFSVDLPALTHGVETFKGCVNLASFSGDLSALINGVHMFGYNTSDCTKLDLASVQHIANTINDLTGKTSDGSEYWGRIDIGISSALQSDDETAPINVALAAIRAKRWGVIELYA